MSSRMRSGSSRTALSMPSSPSSASRSWYPSATRSRRTRRRLSALSSMWRTFTGFPPATGSAMTDLLRGDRLQRAREGERGAVPLAALQPDLSAVQLHEGLGNHEPEAGAPEGEMDLPAVQLLEGAEELRLILLADPDAGVLDADHETVRLGVRPDGHVALPSELHRVRQEVEQHLADLRLVGPHGRERRLDLLVDRQGPAAGQRRGGAPPPPHPPRA